MPSSTYTPESYSLLKQRRTLYAVMNIAASGAVTLKKWTPTSGGVAGAYGDASTAAANSNSPGGTQGIASVTKEATAGQYTVVLQEKAQRLVVVRATFIVPTTGIPAAPNCGVIGAAAPITGGSLTSNTTFVVQFSSGGAATDPASGEEIILEVVVDASGVV